MVKHAISIAIVGGAAALSACFGTAEPARPDQVTDLFTAIPSESCSMGAYIGPVAFGSDLGYMSLLPYQPASNCGNGGGGPISANQSVFTFDLSTGALGSGAPAGFADSGGHVEIAASGSDVAWAYNQMGDGYVYVGPAGTRLGSNQGVDLPLGIAFAGSDVFAGIGNGQTLGGHEVADPSYPSGGEGGFVAMQGSIWKNGTSFMSWSPACTGLDRCIVANATTLAISEVVSGMSEASQISAIAAGDGTRTQVFPVTTGDTPHGLDIDDHYIAWSTTLSCMAGNTSGNCRAEDCAVFVYDLTDPTAAPINLLSTTNFACVDAKLANGYVYFAIVDVYAPYDQLFAPGIGRVKIADRTVETLDLGIRSPGAGPRRVFPVGDQLYLVDPLVMARMPASALDGAQDFTP
jgi:hypothetical protein